MAPLLPTPTVRPGPLAPWLGRVSHREHCRARLRRRNARLRGVALVGLGLIGLKVHAVATLGAGPYAQKVSDMAYGPWFDRGVAWIMQPDPVTLSLAHIARQLVG